MKIEFAQSRAILTDEEGHIHVPFSLYLNDKYNNPHTTASGARALRVLTRLVNAFDIDIASRALEARCLSEGEKKALIQLVYYPIEKIEAMSDQTVRKIASARKEQDPSRIKGTVEQNTARKKLDQIANFLTWYHEKVLEPRMPLASPVTEALRRAYVSCAKELKSAVGGTSMGHPHRIRSVPTHRLLEIYKVVWLKPEVVLQTESGKPGGNLMRDRAMLLLAAEGLRPGAIGNIALKDFKWLGGKEHGYIAINDNTSKRSKRVSTATPTQKGARSYQTYNSTYTIKIWPTTAQAIHDYIDGDRVKITGRTLKNKSETFLFLAEHGGPIGDRGTISTVFRRARIGLQRLRLLSKDEKDPYLEGEEYDFTAYVLRHSAATFFCSIQMQEKKETVVQDLLNMRFGWSRGSETSRRYTLRAMSDAANVTVEDFMESLIAEAEAIKKRAISGEPK